MRTKVVITGMGVVSPVGNDLNTFWTSLVEGRSGIGPITRYDVSDFKTKFGGEAEDCVPEGMTPKDMRRHDRYSLFAVEASDQAWKQSGVDIERENPHKCGVIIGSGIGGLETIQDEVIRFHEGGPRKISPFMIPRGLCNMASGNVAVRFGLKGPNKAIVTACASANHSIAEGALQIQAGRADVMLAGGSEAGIVAFGMAGFSRMGALSTRNDDPQRASRPFDKARDGFVMGEGAGILVLESEAHAKARNAEILAEYAGAGESCDAYHITAPLPDGSGAAEGLQLALDDAQVNPSQIDYFNAHGTSTPHNEVGESKALRTVFGEDMPLVSSTKSMTGHLLGAAGAVEAIACIQAMRTGVIPPNINYETPDPECEVNLVANEARQQNVEIALSNSLGFGGHNAAIVLKRYA